jgi:hypothetical protein
MIALYCQRAEHVALMDRHPIAALDLVHCRDWDQFNRARSQASCSVLLIDCLRSDGIAARLRGGGYRPSDHPMVLVTRKDPESLRLVGSLGIEEVIWFEEIGTALLPAIQRAEGTVNLHRIAQWISESELPGRLRAALSQACRTSDPVQSVAQLALQVGCDRSTLCRQWQKATHLDNPLRLQDVLDWIVFLHGVARRSTGRKWAAIADEIGVGERTLGRMAHRCAGKNLRGLDACYLPGLVLRFEQCLRDALDGQSACNVLT